MIERRELADTFRHPALIAKDGINRGVEIIDPSRFDEAMEELQKEDVEFFKKISTFMTTASIPLRAGHYFPDEGSPGVWWRFTAGYRQERRWT